MGHQPPALAVRALQWLLPESVRESLIGDLSEAFQDDIERGRSEWRARLGFWRESIIAIASLAAHRPTNLQEGSDFMGNLVSDIRFALRHLRGAPGFTLLAVLVMALGIGATTAIFSVVNPVLFRGLPYPDPDRLAMIWERGADGGRSNVGWATFNDFRERSHSFSHLAVMSSWQPTMIGGSEPERLAGQHVSWNYFSLLGVEPALGRTFRPEEDAQSGEGVVILSDGLWRRRFGAQAGIVGQPISIAGTPYVVIGIMPASYQNLTDPTAQLWSPLRYDQSLPYACRTCRHLRMIGRVQPNLTLSEAERELQSLSSAIVQEHPTDYAAAGVLPVPLQKEITGAARPVLLSVLGAVALVLLLACANVTNLLLGRALRRRREFAVRAALGAGSKRIVQQLLTESMLLALVGGIAGLALAKVGLQLLLSLAPSTLPRLSGIQLDGTVLAFALGLTTLTGLLFGLAPALAAARGTLHSTMQSAGVRGGSGRHGGRRILIVSEVALAVMLLLGAGLLLRSLSRVLSVDPGFVAEGTLTMEVQVAGPRYREDPPTWAFFDRALEAVRGVPGVQSAAFTSLLPMGGNFDSYGISIEEKPNSNPELNPSALRFAVSPHYVSTMGIPLLRGRDLTETDADSAAPKVVLINQAFAQHFWAGEDPIGKRVGTAEGGWRTIVGIVGDVHHGGLDETPIDQFYLPEKQWNWADGAMTLVIRTAGDPAALTNAIKQAVWSVDKDQPISKVATMTELLSTTTAERRFALRLFSAFAIVAMVLAAAGIYGALSGSVAERTRELGIRLALGATPVELVVLVLREGGALIGGGLVIGLAGSALLGRGIQSLLYGVSPHDLVAQVIVVGLFAVVGLVAAFVPARRAARLDPIKTLRSE